MQLLSRKIWEKVIEPKKCIRSIDRGEKIVMLPGTDVRLMHPANNIERVRFYDEMLMVEETIRC